MSDPKAQNEPTMEEILASIRRIISENDEEQEAKKRADSPPAMPPSPPEMPAAAAPAPAGVAVLELTEMVNEDGSIVSLTGVDELQEAREFLQSVATQEPEPEPEPIAPPPPPMPEPEPIVEVVEERGTGGIVEQRDENARKAGIEMANPKDDSLEFAPNGSGEKLVSEAAAAATTATFAELARSMAQEPSAANNMALGSGRTLEDLVKEMLRPMLKDWLDRNLPPMVEHMVRRELDRMTRKAEGV